MIAIVGTPVLLNDGRAEPRLVGLAASVAAAAVDGGAPVQLIAKLGDDPDGDAALLAMGRAGFGHVATLRDAAHRTPVMRRLGHDGVVREPGAAAEADDEEATFDPDTGASRPGERATIEPVDPADRPSLDPADVELALRYLPDVTVVVVIEQEPAIAIVAAIEAAASSAHVIVVLPPARPGGEGEDGSAGLPADALVLAPPDDGDPEAFGQLIGRYAALVAGGTSPQQAFERALAGQSAERTTP